MGVEGSNKQPTKYLGKKNQRSIHYIAPTNGPPLYLHSQMQDSAQLPWGRCSNIQCVFVGPGSTVHDDGSHGTNSVARN